MSANLSHAAQGFVNCVVVGKDIVPRLSVVNIGRLIDELVRSLSHLCLWFFRSINQSVSQPANWKAKAIPRFLLSCLYENDQ